MERTLAKGTLERERPEERSQRPALLAAPRPEVRMAALEAECVCPDDCLRDHDNE